MMEKLNDCFVKVTAAATLLVFAFALWRITEGLSYVWVIPALLLGSFLWLFGRRLPVSADRTADRLSVCLFVGMVLLQLLLILGLYRDYLPGVDALSVFSEAVRMAKMNRPVLGSAGRYFEMYGNNYFWTIFLCWYFKLFRMLGLEAYWLEALFLNLLALDLGVLLGAGAVRKCLGRQKGFLFLLLCALNPVLYIFLPYVYTNTISIPFTMGVFYFAWTGVKEENRRRKMLALCGLAAVLAIGMEIRITVWIPCIAMGISCLLQKKLRLSWKASARMLALPLLLFFLLYGGCKLVISQTVPKEVSDGNFPAVHWIMMGLSGEGGYSSEDQEYTYSFPTKEARREGDFQEIKNRAENLVSSGPGGIISFLKKKFCLTWETDMDGYYSEVGPVQTWHRLHWYLNGGGNGWLELYYQTYKIAVYGLCMLAVFCGIMKKREDGGVFSHFSYMLAILGFAVFYLLWEANFRYTLCMTLIFGSLAVPGFDVLPAKCGRKFVLPALFLLLMAGACVCWMNNPLREKASDRTEYVIHTYFRDFHDKWIGQVAERRRTVRQTFVTGHPFDQIRLYMRFGSQTSGERKPWRFRLLDGNQNVLVDRTFGQEWENDDDYKSFGFDRVIPDKKTEYTIEISWNPKESGGEDSMELAYFDFDAYDYVKNAELSVDGQLLHRDLVFQVADRQQAEEETWKK